MPEAEDVLLEGAERATAAARALWRRHRPPDDPPGVALSDLRVRLSLLTRACFGREWPILPSDPDPEPGWLARRLGPRAPWDASPRAEAFTDGVHVFLPRHLRLSSAPIVEGDLLRAMALTLSARLSRGSVEAAPADPVARDLHWVAEGAVADARLAEELPGFVPSLVAARRLALAARPKAGSLSSAERLVEETIRGVLEAPIDRGTAALPVFPRDYPAPEDVAAWARRAASTLLETRTRGFAAIPHWGRPRPDLLRARGEGAGHGDPCAETGGRPRRGRKLSRRVEAGKIDPEEEGAREGPFLVPFGDPQQSVQDPGGLSRPKDRGEEMDLEALAEQLERLGRAPRVRAEGETREILDSEEEHPRAMVVRPEGSEDGGVVIAYPEWDFRMGAYRDGHCRVRERRATPGAPEWAAARLSEHRELLRSVRRRFEALRPRRVRLTRQRDGEELDLDAYVEDFAVRRAGRTPVDRLYLAQRPLRRDVAVAFLIDASGSTDAWVSGGRRVLDVEKEAALVFCESLEALRDRYAVYAFSGRGAAGVRVLRVKGFDERYDEGVRRRIAGVEGDAFTRIGGPIRHLTALLARERARLRLLFLLSDGKPNDEDEYEGEYGVEDTRQATAEARLQGVELFCLTVDREGSAYLPRMFGARAHAVLWEVAQLPERLPDIYRRITSARG